MSTTAAPSLALATSSGKIVKNTANINNKVDMAVNNNNTAKDKSQMTKTEREKARKLAKAQKKANEQDMLQNAARAKAASLAQVSQSAPHTTTQTAKSMKQGHSRKNSKDVPAEVGLDPAIKASSASSVSSNSSDAGKDTDSAITSDDGGDQTMPAKAPSESQQASKVREALIIKPKGPPAVLGGETKRLDSKLRK